MKPSGDQMRASTFSGDFLRQIGPKSYNQLAPCWFGFLLADLNVGSSLLRSVITFV
jgi:hypothetical protein